MIIRNIKPKKVDKKIKPLPFKLRKEPSLIVGNDYYVSFGMNEAAPCVLIDIIDNSQIRIGIKNNSKNGYGGVHIIRSHEIGITPEQAVINTAL